MITLNSASGIIAITFGAKGPNLTISTACSSSAHAIGQALIAIRTGQADVVITGGADASLTPLDLRGLLLAPRAVDLVQRRARRGRRAPSTGRATGS